MLNTPGWSFDGRGQHWMNVGQFLVAFRAFGALPSPHVTLFSTANQTPIAKHRPRPAPFMAMTCGTLGKLLLIKS